MIKLLIIIIFLNVFSFAQKSKERIKYFNNFRFLNSKNINNLSEFNYKDSLVKFEELGLFQTEITNKESQGFGRINDVLLFENDKNLILAGAAAGGLWKSIDYGNNWEYVKTGFGSFGVSKLYEFDGIIYILTGDSELSNISSAFSKGIIYSDDNLKTFNKISVLDSFDFLLTSLIKHDEKLYVSSNYGLFEIEDNISKLIYKRENSTLRSLKLFKNNIYFSFLNNDNSGIVEYNPLLKEFKDIYKDTCSRIELEAPIADPDNLFALIAEKNLNEFRLLKTNDLAQWNIIDIDQKILKNQLDYNLDIEFAPYSKDIILIGGVPLFKTKSNFKDLEKFLNIHFDIHSIKFHPLTNDVFIACDGGLYKISNDLEKVEFLSKGMSISQIFDFDISKNNKDLISIGVMDNGTLQLKNGNWNYIGAGDGMTTKFIDDEVLITSYQRGSIFKHNLKTNSSELISNRIIESNFTPFYTNYIFENDSLFYLNKKLNLYDLNNDTLITFKTPDFEFSSIYKENNFIYTGTINGQLLKFDIEKKSIEYLNTGNIILSEIKKNYDSIYISSSSNLVPGLFIYNLSNRRIEVIDEELRKIPINSFDFDDENIYLGTDDGLLKYNFNSKEITKMTNEGIDIGVVSKVKLRKDFDYLYISTFSNGLFRIKLKDCDLDEVEINLQDTIRICKEDSIKLEILNYNADYWYYLNNKEIINENTSINKEGEYYITVGNTECKNNSKFFYIKHIEKQTASIISPQGNEVCENDSILITLNTDIPSSSSILWNNGKISKSIWVREGEYNATIYNQSTCNVYSDTIIINKIELPTKAVITLDKNTLMADTLVDWYLDDSLIYIYKSEINISYYGTYYALKKGIKCDSQSESLIFSANDKIKYYPNPIENELYIETYFQKKLIFIIEISDLNGKVVYSSVVENENKAHYFKINLNYISSGYYILSIKTNNNVLTGKFFKQ